jgi:hypothetical protein
VSPGRPRNPFFLLGDSDVVIQALVAGLIPKFGVFRRRYGLQPVITEAVAAELPGLLKYRFPEWAASYQKALRVKSLVCLDLEFLENACGVHATVVYENIEKLGNNLWNEGIGRGEAYTHAAGLLLNSPVVSNDSEAIAKLRSAGRGLPEFVLRFFDLVVFFFQIGELSPPECEAMRQALLQRGEHVPRCFDGHSFEDGLMDFFPRLLDSEYNSVGSRDSQGNRDRTMFLSRPPRAGTA